MAILSNIQKQEERDPDIKSHLEIKLEKAKLLISYMCIVINNTIETAQKRGQLRPACERFFKSILEGIGS
jgi:hypothetical protein